MLVSHSRLETLFRKIDQIREEAAAYLIAGDRTVLRVEELQRLVSQMYGLSIDKWEVVTKAIFLQSMVLRYKDSRAVILVRSDLSDTLKKFCVIKELCHLMLDEHEDWSTDARGTIEGLIKIFTLKLDENGDHDPENEVLVCEHLAAFAAAELLYPYEFREGDLLALANELTTYAKLEIKYEAPARVIRLALDPANLGICKQFRQNAE